jgi:hypothetical protein
VVTGGITIGTLTNEDVSDEYGSAATVDYKPFIKNPDISLDKTTRLLRNRSKHCHYQRIKRKNVLTFTFNTIQRTCFNQAIVISTWKEIC